jgi:hypothetical protein
MRVRAAPAPSASAVTDFDPKRVHEWQQVRMVNIKPSKEHLLYRSNEASAIQSTTDREWSFAHRISLKSCAEPTTLFQ